MNPLISQALDNLRKKTKLTETDLNFVMLEMGDLALKVAADVKKNPNANLNALLGRCDDARLDQRGWAQSLLGQSAGDRWIDRRQPLDTGHAIHDL